MRQTQLTDIRIDSAMPLTHAKDLCDDEKSEKDFQEKKCESENKVFESDAINLTLIG